jgi:hypothetical protein
MITTILFISLGVKGPELFNKILLDLNKSCRLNQFWKFQTSYDTKETLRCYLITHTPENINNAY